MKRLLALLFSLLMFAMGFSCIATGNTDNASNTDNNSSTEQTEPTLSGKKFIFLGSSLTYGDGGYSMSDYLEEKYEYTCEIVDWSVSSTFLTHTGDGKSYVERLASSAQYEEDCDHLICQLSTNGSGLPIGEVSDSTNPEDFDTTTIIGAIEFIAATAKQHWNCPVSFFTVAYYESAKYASWVQALYSVQEKWQLGIIDMYTDEEFNDITEEQRAEYFKKDGVHVTKKAYQEWWGPRFDEHLLSYEVGAKNNG